MAWTHPKTAVAGQPVTAADYNTGVRDNLLTVPLDIIGPSDTRWMVSTGPNAVDVPEFLLSRSVSPVTFTTAVDTYTNTGSAPITSCSTGALVHMDWETSRTTDTGGRANMWIRVTATDVNGAVTEAETYTRLFTEMAGEGRYSSSWCDFIPVAAAGDTTFQMQYKLEYTFGTSDGDVVLEDTSMVVFPF